MEIDKIIKHLSKITGMPSFIPDDFLKKEEESWDYEQDQQNEIPCDEDLPFEVANELTEYD